MDCKNFHNYLNILGFSQKEVSDFINGSIFIYNPRNNAPVVKYIHVNSTKEIFDYHQRLWNENNDNVFIAVDKKKTYIIDCKKKPDPNKVLSKPICIDTFDYGVNSKDYEDTNIETISKNYIDSSFFYQFIQQKQRNKQEVDKDLLLNLIALRNDLIRNNEELIVHLLILRCLFVKYLEDRGIFDTGYLPDILSSKSPQNLISAFNEVCKINGDVFGNKRINEKEINIETLEKLFLFFTTDYQSGQGTLFPYQFNNIPIQLISHVYEAFLNDRIKKGRGIYYTPSFVVDFMLSMSLKHKVKDNLRLTVLDPAVGSGAFLVESFKILRDEQAKKSGKHKLSYDEKIKILEKQIHGIDIDADALQIAAFSLYLVLLEDEEPEFIRKKIKHSHPILPALIGKNLIYGNTITDDIFREEKFDVIVSNPPWGSVPDSRNKNNIAEREAINNTDNKYPEYENVSDYERSQAFLRRIEKWQKPDTLNVMIVKNSVFLNENTFNFRKDFLNKNRIHNFFELSHYNKILFKKKTYKSPKITVDIGASEPCVIVEFKPYSRKDNYEFNYISPKLTKLGEHFELIQYTGNDIFKVNKNDFFENDLLWRILVNGDKDYIGLIEKIDNKKNKKLIVNCDRGFEPFSDNKMYSIGKSIYFPLLTPNKFDDYIKNGVSSLKNFKWNRNFRRLPVGSKFSKDYFESKVLSDSLANKDKEFLNKCYNKKNDFYFIKKINNNELKLKLEKVLSKTNNSIYTGKKILIDRTPINAKRIKAVVVDNGKVLFKDNILCMKIENCENYFPYYSIIRSLLASFYINNTSPQIAKGKRNSIRVKEVENFPFPFFSNNIDKNKKISDNEVFNLYKLTEYETEIIKEFYQVNVERADERLKQVQSKDITNYFSAFKEAFSLVLSAEHTLNASYHISQNIGAILKISIVDKQSGKNIFQDNTLQILRFVKNNQLKETDKLLKEEKIKIYEPNHFYIIKSNQFKDWTIRQAYKDAKEEINQLLSKLPDTNE